MENRDNQNPPTDQQTDLSKAQNQQQPQGQQGGQGGQFQQGQQGQQGGQFQQPAEGQFQKQSDGQSQQTTEGQSQQQPPEGQAEFGSADKAGQSDTTTEQRSDIEGGTATGQASDFDDKSQFVGSQGANDTSSELIEDDDDFAKDGQGSTE